MAQGELHQAAQADGPSAAASAVAPAADSAERRGLRFGMPAALVGAAAVGWWWSVRMADEMSGAMGTGMAGAGMGSTGMDSTGMGSAGMGEVAMGHSLSFAGFVVAWVAMMGAMMFPAISPVVRLYGLAAAKRRVAPLPFFVAAYLAVWGSMAIPAYVAWRGLDEPLADGAAWAARLAGGVLLAAAVWQLTPLKSVCLRHCRSPLSFFMQHSGRASAPLGAFRMGAAHGLFCLGCCWALMAVLVAMGTMDLAWMAALAVMIFLEKNARMGEQIAIVAAAVFAATGVALVFRPDLITSLT